MGFALGYGVSSVDQCLFVYVLYKYFTPIHVLVFLNAEASDASWDAF